METNTVGPDNLSLMVTGMEKMTGIYNPFEGAELPQAAPKPESTTESQAEKSFIPKPSGSRFTVPETLPANLLDPHGVLGAQSILPGHNGIPFRGPVPHLRESDPEYRQPQTGHQAKVEILDLAKPDDLTKYQDIIQMTVNGFAEIGLEDQRYDEATKNWRVLIRWYKLFSYMPKSR